MLKVDADPNAPKDPALCPDYWDRRRELEGKPDLSRCAADLRVALAARGVRPALDWAAISYAEVEALAPAGEALCQVARGGPAGAVARFGESNENFALVYMAFGGLRARVETGCMEIETDVQGSNWSEGRKVAEVLLAHLVACNAELSR